MNVFIEAVKSELLKAIQGNYKIRVLYLYKDKTGKTQAIRLFDIPSMRKKLTVMGPGEVYEDTLLGQLEDEIMSLKDTLKKYQKHLQDYKQATINVLSETGKKFHLIKLNLDRMTEWRLNNLNFVGFHT